MKLGQKSGLCTEVKHISPSDPTINAQQHSQPNSEEQMYLLIKEARRLLAGGHQGVDGKV